MFDSNVKNVSAKEAYNLIKDDKEVVILDVRSKEEYDSGHIPGAKLVPVQVLGSMIDELDKYKEKKVLVYCESGRRSPIAVDTLADNDFKNIYHLSRGIASWKYDVSK
ncbi:rhodanese-like domain-containing protein [Clostridium estertheticum]|uniref:rhodanese-like domain-containing protein n=1 Tax=Clostridium estertheticum TaxID=238834 RepID=UPI001C6EFBF7|nr:rhodanese-like domain-containing protein [Clostridium estertheticum]MBW9171258.1 rhodanese-like domain-containing protein [Clostridium estertheticum]WLC76822.1 rhodanese-like domain-containing protein [Clostridium estertheticum]